MEQTKSKKSVFFIIGAIVGAAIASFAVLQLFFNNAGFDKQLIAISSEMNKSCPYMVDKDTRLDNTVMLPEKTLQYNYTLVNMEVKDLDLVYLRDYVEKNVTATAKTNPDLKIYRDNEVTLAYAYKDKNGVFLFKVDVGPDKYK